MLPMHGDALIELSHSPSSSGYAYDLALLGQAMMEHDRKVENSCNEQVGLGEPQPALSAGQCVPQLTYHGTGSGS